MMSEKKKRVTSGVSHLDTLLGGGIIIGDNVVWYDDAGSLASLFCINLIKASQKQKKFLIYICFDHSPKKLLERLGHLSQSKFLTILDCFTNGKGEGAEIFQKFYTGKKSAGLCQIIKVEEPHNIDHVTGTFYGLHKTMKGDVRFVFDSLTGMQELWGEEDQMLKFYSHACPRLYELNTIAYWIVEKEVHSQRFKAHLNKITQVAIDLSLKRGKTSLTVLKADKRDLGLVNKPSDYWNKGIDIFFDSEKKTSTRLNIGSRLKEFRTKRGFSQTDLAKQVGVTSSTISQVENNQIYPSLPALIKMSEILSVDINSFFHEIKDSARQVIFSKEDAVNTNLPALPKGLITARLLTQTGFESKAEPYLIEIPAKTKVNSHFFIHKGEEFGYLLSGQLIIRIENRTYTANQGDLIYLKTEIPSQWENPGHKTVNILWMIVK